MRWRMVVAMALLVAGLAARLGTPAIAAERLSLLSSSKPQVRLFVTEDHQRSGRVNLLVRNVSEHRRHLRIRWATTATHVDDVLLVARSGVGTRTGRPAQGRGAVVPIAGHDVAAL